jgi:hypothetical protein
MPSLACFLRPLPYFYYAFVIYNAKSDLPVLTVEWEYMLQRRNVQWVINQQLPSKMVHLYSPSASSFPWGFGLALRGSFARFAGSDGPANGSPSGIACIAFDFAVVAFFSRDPC